MPNNLCHFEFMVSDVEKAKRFYTTIFDWKLDENTMSGYTMIDAGVAPGGGIVKKPDDAPTYAMSIYFCVDSIDETLKKIEAAGGTVEVPKTEIPVGFWALFLDPDGIPVGLFEGK